MYLNCHSYYSFKFGTLSPEQLVAAAAKRGIKQLVLTDINSCSGAFPFLRACQKHDIRGLLGLEFRNEDTYLYTGIAQDEEGFRELNALLTECSINNKDLPERAPVLRHAIIIYQHPPFAVELLRPHEYIGIRPDESNRLFGSKYQTVREKLVVWQPVTFLDLPGFRTHKLLRCIDRNLVLGKLKDKHIGHPNDSFVPEETIKNNFGRFPQILYNTESLLDQCSINLPLGYHNNRQTFTGNGKDDFQLLQKLAMQGWQRRYGNKNQVALRRVEKELGVIDKQGFSPYFLITWDIVRYAQSCGYHHVGRGSGANSIVAFCLYITDVDPLELDLYFERFINPHRTSPPDFDIDFSWDQRDDVTEYVFNRYGHEHTALLATYNTFKGKSIIRELGKVFGLPKDDIDTIVNEPLATQKHHHFAKHIFNYGNAIEKFPNYLSIHAGGILVSERALNYFTPLKQMPKGFPITHFDMYHAEDMGFHKYDILSQRGLGHIKEAVDIVRENKGVTVDIHDVQKIKEDKAVRQQLKSGHCIGCFYIESPAMRGLLSKLRCDNYIHLVAASSIIRPGVAKSGMMREYIHRFHHPNSFEYIHDVFKENLQETFGVMVYQEDVMKIVHHFAGLDLDESDVLRRIMTGKKKSSDTFLRLRDKYFRNCAARGYTTELSQEVWRQIESFSGYSFCKAHSASFAVESFQSLYLKKYFPLEFMVAVINNFGGFYSTELYVHEARMQGAKIHPPCVNNSRFLTSIQGEHVYLGFVHIHSLERKISALIVEERMSNGPYRSLADFCMRIDISKEQLELLIRINAFRFTKLNKYELMWEKNAVHNPKIQSSHNKNLFPVEHDGFSLPQLKEGKYEQAFDEIELLGFPLCSPFDLLSEQVEEDILSKEMSHHTGKTVNMLGYYVTRKNVTTVNRKLMNFGTWVDREGHFFDTTHFPQSLSIYPFRGKGIYWIRGVIVEDFGFPSMETISMKKLPYVKDARY